MPDAIRIAGGGFFRARPRLGGFRLAGAALCAFGTITPAGADDAIATSAFGMFITTLAQFDRYDMAGLALLLAILCFAVVSAISLVRTRRRLAECQAAAHDEAVALKGEVDRMHALLCAEPQFLVTWAAGAEVSDIIGDPTLVTSADAPHRVLAFGTWLEPDKARAMEAAVEALRTRGVGFSAMLTTLAGRPIEAEGQVIGGRAILRVKAVAGIKRELADVQMRLQKQSAETEAMRTLIEALPSPVWARDQAGKLAYVNSAYAGAVEVNDGTEAHS